MPDFQKMEFSFDDLPTTEDIALTSSLDQLLRCNGTYETKENAIKREAVLQKITQLFDRWVKNLGVNKHVPESLLSKAGARVLPFGSARLGVNGQSSDIDVLCLAPHHVCRHDFFTLFYELLKTQDGVANINCVADAFVPVITMTFDGIDVDLLFARLGMPFIPSDLDLSNDAVLINMDKKCIRSVNGQRVTEKFLHLVPNEHAFRMTLRAVKLWAKKRGIYSNVLGYLGGVSWALLVAKTCQQYPRAMPAVLLQKFFLMYSKWQWPRPVLIDHLTENNARIAEIPSWDPRINHGDALHFMPVITPCYPHINSTFNVSQSTMEVIIREFDRGLKVMDGTDKWNILFEATNFFGTYRHFFVITIEALNEQDHQAWQGYFQTKIKYLARQLETNKSIDSIQINPEPFPVKATIRISSRWFVGLKFDRAKGLNVDLGQETTEFVRSVETAGCQPPNDGKTFKIEYASRKQLPQFVDLDKMTISLSTPSPLSPQATKRKRDNEVVMNDDHADLKPSKKPRK